VRHDPGFALADPGVTSSVTLRDLFAHRSGLPDHAGDLLEDLGFGRGEILRRLRYAPLDNDFRAAYAYTNFGLTETAVAVADAAGASWEDLSSARLYQPLHMTSTSSRYADYLAAADRAVDHVRTGTTWVAGDRRNPDAQSPAGGASSSVRDLAQWLRLQLNDGVVDGQRVIAAEPLAEIHRPQIVSRPPTDPATDRAGFYGLGWGVSYDDHGQVMLSHSGAFNTGAATAVYLLPADKLGIVVLTNGSPIGVAETVALSFLDLARYGSVQRDYWALLEPAFAALNAPTYGTDRDYSKPPPAAAPAAPAAAYLGTYANDFYGPLRVRSDGPGLVLELGPEPDVFPLTHFDGDVFTYQPVGENAYGPSPVRFGLGPTGRATSVLVDNLDRDGLGHVTGLGAFERPRDGEPYAQVPATP
jgi:CubicO group peptidase (beta-lactamase class C family)